MIRKIKIIFNIYILKNVIKIFLLLFNEFFLFNKIKMGCSHDEVKETSKLKRRLSQFSGSDIKKNYELIYVLGTGSFGKVRLYRDRTNNELLYAIKTLKKEGISKTNYELIQSEINILSK